MQKREDLLRRLDKLSSTKQTLLAQRLQQDAPEVTVTAAVTTLSPERTQVFPLSSSQQRFWFLQELDPEDCSYNETSAFRFKGQMNLAVLERALQEVIQRHAIMRSTFRVVDGQVMQMVDPSCQRETLLSIVDLCSGPLARREVDIQCALDQALLLPFRLAEKAPWRFTLIRCNEEEYIFLAVMHHIITDAWSAEIFVRELGALYIAFAHNLPSPLPALLVQYPDYVYKQQQTLEHAHFTASLNYWQEQLAGHIQMRTGIIIMEVPILFCYRPRCSEPCMHTVYRKMPRSSWCC